MKRPAMATSVAPDSFVLISHAFIPRVFNGEIYSLQFWQTCTTKNHFWRRFPGYTSSCIGKGEVLYSQSKKIERERKPVFVPFSSKQNLILQQLQNEIRRNKTINKAKSVEIRRTPLSNCWTSVVASWNIIYIKVTRNNLVEALITVWLKFNDRQRYGM